MDATPDIDSGPAALPVERRPYDPRRWESITEEVAVILRQKTGAERLAIAEGMWRSVYKLVWQAVRNQHPDWPEDRVRKAVASRMSHGAV